MWKFALAVGLFLSSTVAVPTVWTPTLLERQTTDAPYTFSSAQLGSVLVCPNGTANTNGIALLVHGTGSTGNETWGAGPYTLFLPQMNIAVCWVNLPMRALGDMPTTAEYVAYNIQQLAPKSATGKVICIGHSQGAGLNIQWALLYWPSTRNMVSRYIALSGDFHGTSEGPLFCSAEDLARQGCQVSVIQQSIGSMYLAAQNHRGNTALVPTTSIYTRYDEIIQDENLNPTSILPSADNYALQDLTVCGPTHIAEHFVMVVDPAAFEIAKLAIGAGAGHTPIAKFDKRYCTYLVEDQLLNLTAVPALLQATFTAAVELGVGGAVVKKEPQLPQYVCDAGDAPQSQCS